MTLRNLRRGNGKPEKNGGRALAEGTTAAGGFPQKSGAPAKEILARGEFLRVCGAGRFSARGSDESSLSRASK